MRAQVFGLALFVLAAALGLVLVIATITTPIGARTTGYTAIFTDVSGLRTGGDVRMSGVPVGKVTSIILDQDKARVGFTVRSDQPLYADTGLAVRFRDFTGQRYLALEQSQPLSGVLPAGATIPVERTAAPFDFSKLFNALRPIFTTVDPAQVDLFMRTVLALVQGQDPTGDKMLTSVATITANLAQRQAVLRLLVEHLAAFAAEAGGRSHEFLSVATQLAQVIATLRGDLGMVNAAVDSSMAAVGALADIASVAAPALDESLPAAMKLANGIADRMPALGSAMTRWPPTLEAYLRTADQGSYFAAQVCRVRIDIWPLPVVRLTGPEQSAVCR
ncbi:MCE family protein [Nocardia sp. NPDC051570]|uniref:MCE family protein n=1 Tax=Nocardia sp. NPDC051570 TaxID=3364324 RepID=UPI0037B4BB37